MSNNVIPIDFAAHHALAALARSAAEDIFDTRSALRIQLVDVSLELQSLSTHVVAVTMVGDEQACLALERLTDRHARALRRLEVIHEQYALLARGKAGA